MCLKLYVFTNESDLEIELEIHHQNNIWSVDFSGLLFSDMTNCSLSRNTKFYGNNKVVHGHQIPSYLCKSFQKGLKVISETEK